MNYQNLISESLDVITRLREQDCFPPKKRTQLRLIYADARRRMKASLDEFIKLVEPYFHYLGFDPLTFQMTYNTWLETEGRKLTDTYDSKLKDKECCKDPEKCINTTGPELEIQVLEIRDQLLQEAQRLTKEGEERRLRQQGQPGLSPPSAGGVSKIVGPMATATALGILAWKIFDIAWRSFLNTAGRLARIGIFLTPGQYRDAELKIRGIVMSALKGVSPSGDLETQAASLAGGLETQVADIFKGSQTT